ncbi:MAG: 16S rRNA (cytosine(1402)-N(4))-methyltransferase RsmH [Christensenella sp.]|nr:16S rRNA (cytosine(1402)-N(4))-methyltransferase RsmH [Christensenella sp.]
MSAPGKGHIPVLYRETLDMLDLRSGMTIVDGTLGGAGHAHGILQRIMPDGLLIGIDKDTAAIDRCKERLHDFAENIMLVHDDFKNIRPILEEYGIGKIDGAVLDLGVSSFQLDESERGFSYQQDAPLDMRMNRDAVIDAKKIVNEYSVQALTQIIRDYGEEKWAARIAQFIERERLQKPIETTAQLAQVIKNAIPASARREGPHPAKRTFQAIRIEVNGELNGLGQALEDYVSVLKSGGRLAVITFHSLEDRIVKQTFKKLFDPCVCPKDFPVCVCGKVSQIKLITRKPKVADDDELLENPRARSAKLRVVEKK